MRQSSIELCRIVAIILIILLHTGFQISGFPSSMEDTSIMKLSMQAFSNVGVNVFLLITGYFSATPKLKSLINVSYICLFCAIVATVLGIICGMPFPVKRVLFITSSNWFIPSYICLLFLAPVLNGGAKSLTQRRLLWGGVILYALLTWFGWFPALAAINPGLNNGCSVIWFVFVYLTGRYIRLYGLPKWFERYSLIVFIIGTMLLVLCAYFILQFFNYKVDAIIGRLYGNNSPFVFISAIALFVWFKNLEIKDSKCINYIAQSVLSVLLLHGCVEVSALKKVFYPWLEGQFHGLILGALWILSVIVMFIICVLIDQLRIISYKPIKKILDSKLK